MAGWIKALFSGLAAVILLTAATSCRSEEGRTPVLRVVVTIPPLAGWVRALVPEGSEVRVLLKPGRSEHGFELTSADLNALAKADLLVYVGLGLEPKVEDFIGRRPEAKRIDLSFARAIGLETGEAAEAHDHQHGDHDHGDHEHAHDEHDHEEHAHGEGEEHGDHVHGPIDPHLWLDPVLVEQFVPSLRDAVIEAMKNRGTVTSQEQERVNAAAANLAEQVRALHRDAMEALRPLAGETVVTHHAAWGRFLERYGMAVAAVIRPIETSEPTPAAIASALDAIKRHNVRAIFIEPQFSRAAADRIAQETGVSLGTLDPLGNGDWFATMRGNIDVLRQVLGSPR